MKAAVAERYGPAQIVQIREVPKPQPKSNEVLVRVRASSVEIADARIRGMRVPTGLSPLMRLAMGLTKPKCSILGLELAGDVEAVGSNVSRFEPGDRVVGSPGFRLGCHAEYCTLAENGAIALIPERLSYEEAVAVLFGGSTAEVYFRVGDLKAGEHILINGASGSVGVAAVALAKHLGAEVTAVCSGRNADIVRSLGADHVIDYTQQDFAAGDCRYDVVMDNVGNAAFARAKKVLRPNGRLLVVIFASLWQMIGNAFNRRAITVSNSAAEDVFSPAMYGRLMALAEHGVLRPVIDSRYPLDRIADAHARVDTGHKVGCVVVVINAADTL